MGTVSPSKIKKRMEELAKAATSPTVIVEKGEEEEEDEEEEVEEEVVDRIEGEDETIETLVSLSLETVQELNRSEQVRHSKKEQCCRFDGYDGFRRFR